MTSISLKKFSSSLPINFGRMNPPCTRTGCMLTPHWMIPANSTNATTAQTITISGNSVWCSCGRSTVQSPDVLDNRETRRKGVAWAKRQAKKPSYEKFRK